MCLADIAKRSFSYSFDSFISCSNLRRVTASDITITTEASSTLSPLSIIHHSPLHFTSPSILQSYSVPKPMAHTSHHIDPPEDIIWLSFDSITTCFGSLLSLWPGGMVTDFRFEKTCTIIVLLPSSPNLLYHNIQHFHIFFITLNCLKYT